MSDDRREFLKAITAMLGGIAAFPEVAEALQTPAESKVRLEPPIRSNILKREEARSASLLTSYLEVELLGSNNTKQVFMSLSSKANDVTSSLHMTVATHEDATNPTPTGTSEFTMVLHSKKLDANHSEVSGTLVMPDGKVSKIGPLTATRPSNLPKAGDLTDEELLQRFLAPKLNGVTP